MIQEDRVARNCQQSARAYQVFVSFLLDACPAVFLDDSQFMFITAYRKRKTTLDDRVIWRITRVLEWARRQQRIVRRIKRNGAKLLPISYHRLFGEDLMQRNLALRDLVSICSQRKVLSGYKGDALTSRSWSTGTLISSAISLFPRKISPVRLQQHAGTAILAKTRS